jgi:hypothetical protein
MDQVPNDLELVDLGDAKEVTKGMHTNLPEEDSLTTPYRQQP